MMFLKVFFLMAIFSVPSSGFAQNTPPKVVVVGAGLAGLTAAHRLHAYGLDVQVYEARPRVGGRMFTVYAADEVADLGGANVNDGGAAENMKQLIQEFGLELEEHMVRLTNSYFAGHEFISLQECLRQKQFDPEALKTTLWQLAEHSTCMQEVLDGILERDDPLYKIMSVRLEGYEGGSIDKLSSCYTETLYHMLLGGISYAHQANIQEDPQVVLESIKGGSARLPEKIALQLGSRVHMNMPLTKIVRVASGSYELYFGNGLQKAQQDAQVVHADIVVLAIPASVYCDITFEKGIIPEEKLAAIQAIQYGQNAKIMIPLSDPPTTGQGFLNDHMGSFFAKGTGLMTLYYVGKASKFSTDTISTTYLSDRPMLELGLGLSCPAFALPQIARNELFSSYEGPVGYSWPNDPFAKGSYSYIASGQEEVMTATTQAEGEVVKTLFAPINHTLYFAGEHTSILFDVPGTMESACESGERAARMILKGL